MVIGLYYYLRIVKAMFMDERTDPVEKLRVSPLPKLAMLLCGAGVLFTGFAGWVYEYIFSLGSGV